MRSPIRRRKKGSRTASADDDTGTRMRRLRSGAEPAHTTNRLATTADRLHSAAIHLLRRLRRQDDASGLSAPRLSALSVIVYGGPISLRDLAAAEQVRAPTMSRLVAALVEAGLVKRHVAVDDRRAIALRATQRGVAVLKRGRERRTTRLAEALADLPRRDLVQLDRAIGSIERVVKRL
ncbi:MAG: MarR family winged helix-turn-helix transcriptional regulator [Gemmatimonadota bacterium]